jgi:protein phosphatase
LVHVGDSRAYLRRGEQLVQITHDDTYVQHLVDSGKITAEEAKDHPRKSVILRALSGAEVDPDVSIRETRVGDRYLLCTDGLSDYVTFATIAETLRITDPQEAADRLVELALRTGAPDNVTVIVADIAQSRLGESVDDVPVIAGAFIDPAAADVPGEGSPADRAARMGRPHPPSRPSTAASPRRTGWRRWRRLVIALAVLVLLAAGLGGTYAWTQAQFFVGKDGTAVAIFHGVSTEVGPVKLYGVEEHTDLQLAQLEPSIRSQISSGITAKDLADARNIVDRLKKDHLLPYCESAQLPGDECRSP